MKKETMFEIVFWLVIIVIYSGIGWFLCTRVLKPAAKRALHYFAPPTIERQINTDKSDFIKDNM